MVYKVIWTLKHLKLKLLIIFQNNLGNSLQKEIDALCFLINKRILSSH